MKRSQRRRKRNGLKLMTVVVLAICGVVLVKTKELDQEVANKNKKIDKLNEQIDTEKERGLSLADEKAYQSTKRYIEEIARNVLGLYYPDEIIFKESN